MFESECLKSECLGMSVWVWVFECLRLLFILCVCVV